MKKTNVPCSLVGKLSHMHQTDMHGYPVYENVVQVQNDLKEEQLRDMHLDLKQAWDEYKVLLEKYKFWDDINK